MNNKPVNIEGIYPIYKPVGITSHDVVDRVRKISKRRKVGHAGTLDPAASGVLVVGIGRSATKRLHEHVKKEKEYVATIHFGKESSTDDREGEITSHDVKSIPSEKEVREILKMFQGEITQTPPRFSAIKIDGVPAYRRARRGEKFEMPPRIVHIYELELVSYSWPQLVIRTVTGSGTYIRALARDIGDELHVGAYLEELERTRVGSFEKKDSLTIEEFENINNRQH